MIDPVNVKAIHRAMNDVVRAKDRLAEAQYELIAELKSARFTGHASLSELASILGVSRQRVHQLTKES